MFINKNEHIEKNKKKNREKAGSFDPWDTVLSVKQKYLTGQKKGEKVNREKIILLCTLHNSPVK